MTQGIARKGFDLDLRDGVDIENTILRLLVSDTRVEVKYEPMARTHLFVELQSRGAPSGLATTEAEWWAIVYDNGDRMLWIKTTVLRELAQNRTLTRGGDHDTSIGVAVPIADLAKPRAPRPLR